MKLFCTSDVHSHFTHLKRALEERGFEPNNQEHLLILCGDCFDRGSESVELLDYLNTLTNIVLIRGNHEDLLEEVWHRGYCLSHDYANGTQKTINDIFFKYSNLEPYEPIRVSEKVLSSFLSKMVNYYETEHYIFCHSWIPCTTTFYGSGESKPWYTRNKTYEYTPDWREANEVEWKEARWGNPFKMAESGLNKTGKTIVFGHWHTSWPRANYEGKPEFGAEADFNPYFGDTIVGLDACTAHSNMCNVIVLEDNIL